MAPVVKKTYEKKSGNRKVNPVCNKSSEILDRLFTKNLSKRRNIQKKIIINNLPEPTSTVFTNDSFQLPEDSFDKIRNGIIYNKVNLQNSYKKIESSDSDLSKSKTVLKEISIPLPPRAITKKRTRKQVGRKKSEEKVKETIVPNNKIFDQPIDVSLEVENVAKKIVGSGSLSYIDISCFRGDGVRNSPCLNYTKLFSSINILPCSTPAAINTNSCGREEIHVSKEKNISIVENENASYNKVWSKSKEIVQSTPIKFENRYVTLRSRNICLDSEAEKNNQQESNTKHSCLSLLPSMEYKNLKINLEKNLDIERKIEMYIHERNGFDSDIELKKTASNKSLCKRKSSRTCYKDLVVVLERNLETEKIYNDNMLTKNEDIENLSLSLFENRSKIEYDKFENRSFHSYFRNVSDDLFTDIKSQTKLSNRKSKIDKEIETITIHDSIDLNEKSLAQDKSIRNKEENECEFPDIIEVSVDEDQVFYLPKISKQQIKKEKISLKPGKLWRRSLCNYIRNSILPLPDSSNFSDVQQNRRSTIRIIPKFADSIGKPRISYLENLARGYVSKEDIDVNLENSIRSLSLNTKRITSFISQPLETVTARDIVLRRCGQTDPLQFETCYTTNLLKNCQKIGEGVYGEVFLYKNPNGGTTVLKIIPIEGNQIVNGERQKKFQEILSEIVISMELSNLRKCEKNLTSCFTEVQSIKCVHGCYPEKLLDLWNLYDETRGSENDSPEIFKSDQLYIVLELANAGTDLEAFEFSNAQQCYSMFQQVACALAVAEAELRFEHRDLHWGNVLLKHSQLKKINFCINGETIEIMSNGIEATIIDFTLSRIECDDVVIYNDLSEDEDLFSAAGDYQFDIYRLMQNKNGNNWQDFEPYTNILWLHYILTKCLMGVRYKNKRSRSHKEFIKKLDDFKNCILNFNSAKDFVLDIFLN